MKFQVICTLLLFTVFAQAVHSKDPPPEYSKVKSIFTYYYINKDIDELIKYLEFLEDSKMLDEKESAVAPTAAFLSIAFSDNPSQVTRLAKCDDFSGKTKEAVQIALWRSGHKQQIAEFFGETPAFAKKKPTSLKKRRIEGPGDLDMMWGAFLASGDVSYVRRIIEVLEPKHPLSGDDEKDSVTRGAAEWSLKSNMIQHELVYRLIRAEAGSRTGSVKRSLQEMLASAKPRGSMPHMDGPLSADLFVMDDKELAEFDKPVDEAPRIGHKSTAKRGDIVGIKIVFAGIELADDLKADVVYDLKVLDPDGGLYDETDLKGLKALSGKIPTRFRVFNNMDLVKIRFEPKDKLGTYQISATIRDKVGDRAVSLERTIELKE